MNLFAFFGLFANIIGIIFLAWGFQIEKAEDKSGFTINGKWAIVLKHESPFLRNLGWFLILLGFILQMTSLFYN